jgi:hypothetical protein
MQFQLKSMKDRASRRSILKLLFISIPVTLTRNTTVLLRPMARTSEPFSLSQIKTVQQGECMPLVRVDLIPRVLLQIVLLAATIAVFVAGK